MSLVYAGVLSHAPGITGRAHLVENTARRDEFYAALASQRQDILAAGTEVDGPAVIEEPASVTIVRPGLNVRVDTYGNLLLGEIAGTPAE